MHCASIVCVNVQHVRIIFFALISSLCVHYVDIFVLIFKFVCVNIFMLNLSLCELISLCWIYVHQSFYNQLGMLKSNLCASYVCIKYIYGSMLNGVHQVYLWLYVNLHYESNLCCELNLCALWTKFVYCELNIFVCLHCESVCLSLWVCLCLKSKLFHILLLSQIFHNATRAPPKLQLQIIFSNRNLDMGSPLVILNHHVTFKFMVFSIFPPLLLLPILMFQM